MSVPLVHLERAQRVVGEALSERAPDNPVVDAVAGNGNGIVAVPGRDGYIYAMIRNDPSRIVQAQMPTGSNLAPGDRIRLRKSQPGQFFGYIVESITSGNGGGGGSGTTSGGTIIYNPTVNLHVETPIGTVDGTNAVFTLSNTPNVLVVSVNGLVLRRGVGSDYVLSGSTITFQSGAVPRFGDYIQAMYT